MSNNYFQYGSELADFENMWAKAQEDGVFKDVEKEPMSPSSQTADVNYFGVISGNPSTEIKDVDAEYWNQLHSLNGFSADPSDVLREILESDTMGVKEKVGRIANNANPIPASSLGKDTDPNASEAKPFEDKDLKSLIELKGKMHDLGAKIAEYAAKGNKTTDLESKLKSLHNQMDDLSDVISGASTDSLLGGK